MILNSRLSVHLLAISMLFARYLRCRSETQVIRPRTSGTLGGESGRVSAFEGSFFVLIDQFKEIFDRAYAGARPVAVPLQVGSHPVNFPLTATFDVSGIREA